MSRVRRINVSQIEGNDANDNNIDEIRPFGEIGVYANEDGNTDKPELLMFDGVRTHLKSKVLAQGILYGSNADSGDGAGLDTIKLIPDAELYRNDGLFGNDQYIVVDPTAPNHIHLRAGGTMDNSNAALFLGGENSNVEIQAGTNPPVYVRANNNTWMFDVDGSITFPDNTVQTTAFTGTGTADTGNITFSNNEIQGNPLGTVGTIITVNQNRVGGTIQNSNVFELTKSTDTDQVQVGWVIRGDGGTPQTITLVADGGSYWQFFVGSGISTQFPITIESADYQLGTNPELILTVDPDGVDPKSWTFSSTGSITFPDATVQTTAYTSGTVPTTILDLGITDGTLGQVLTANGDGTFSFTTVSGVSNTLDGLTDVAITTPANGEYLTYNNGTWINTALLNVVSSGDNVSLLTNDAGYLTSFTETDPVFTASEAATITSTDTANWDAAHSWGDHSTAGYLVPTINTTSATATALADDATANLELTGGRAYVMYKIQTSHAAWVRIYTNAASRTADAGRLQGVDPGINAGVIAEAITAGAETVVFAPAVNGFNDETVTTSAMPIAVTNLSGATNDVVVTVTKLTMVA
jgi:hypothetical protein